MNEKDTDCGSIAPDEIWVVVDGLGDVYYMESDAEARETADFWNSPGQPGYDKPHTVHRYVRATESGSVAQLTPEEAQMPEPRAAGWRRRPGEVARGRVVQVGDYCAEHRAMPTRQVMVVECAFVEGLRTDQAQEVSIIARGDRATECRSVAERTSVLEQVKSEVEWGSEPEGVAKRLDSMISNMTYGNAHEKWPPERKMAVWACWWELMGYQAGLVHVTLPELVTIASRVTATEQESVSRGEGE